MKAKTTRSHYEKFKKLSERVPDSAVPKQCGSKELVRHYFEKDQYLNNVPMPLWDKAAGCHYYSLANKLPSVSAGLDFWLDWDAPWTPDIANHLSLAERVCILKHIAIYRIGEIEPEFEAEVSR